jgi:hypothetical protein
MYYSCTHHCSLTSLHSRCAFTAHVLTIVQYSYYLYYISIYNYSLTIHVLTSVLFLRLYSPRYSYKTCTKHCTLPTRLLITELFLHLHSPVLTIVLLLQLCSTLYSYYTSTHHCSLTTLVLSTVLSLHLYSLQYSYYCTPELTAVLLINSTYHNTLYYTFTHHCTLSYFPLASYISENIHRWLKNYLPVSFRKRQCS